MIAVCEHVPLEAARAIAVTQTRPTRMHFQVHCPCCGMTAWQAPDASMDDFCPYCWVQPVRT